MSQSTVLHFLKVMEKIIRVAMNDRYRANKGSNPRLVFD